MAVLRDIIAKRMTQITRRNLLQIAGASPLVALQTRDQPRASARKPNIVLVLLDDLGFGQFAPNTEEFTLSQIDPTALKRDAGDGDPLKALDAAKSAAPNLSRFAREGTLFTDGYVACPLCAPSRAGLMTAQYPQRFGGYGNQDIERGGVPVNQPLPVQWLRNNGYATAAIGKWHIAKMQGGMDPGSGQHPLDRGFDYFFGFNRFGTEYYDSRILIRNREKAEAKGYLTDQFTDEALGFIGRNREKPLFLYLPYNAVHGPLDKPAPDRYRSRFKTGVFRVDNFYAYLAAADEGIARIVAAAVEHGGENNTLLIFLSDNGAPGASPIPSNGPFLGYKGQVWQGGLRVPMMMWGAGIPRGKIVRDPVISMDLMATALGASKTPVPQGSRMDGRNLLPYLNGEQRGPVRESLCWAGQLARKWMNNERGASDEMTAPPAWAIRRGRWMLRFWSSPDRYELYDLDRDKGERENVADANAKLVRDLKIEYSGWIHQMQKPIAWPEEYWRKVVPEQIL